ncbi:MAG: oligosaccharide flippase family protein [Cellulosilyticaceae bacterium]
MSKKALITGTLILTGASFITRILGFIFRIYMSNIMGAEGMGLYQLVFPIYMLIWATSSAGLALAVSKKVAEFTSKKQPKDAIRTLNAALLLVFPLSIVISAILFFGAGPIAIKFVHEPKTMLSIKLLASCVPFMATACCIKGYFQGRQEMTVPALTQIGEQVARMVIIYLFAGYFIPKGLEYACALGVLGMCVGEICSCLFAVVMYRIKRSKLGVQKSAPASCSYAALASTIFAIAVPITANRFLTSSLQSIENILIPIQLQKFGLDPSSALSVYGMFSGMALPLLFFPSMVTASISTVSCTCNFRSSYHTQQIYASKNNFKSDSILCTYWCWCNCLIPYIP